MTGGTNRQQGRWDRTSRLSAVQAPAGAPIIDSAQLLADRREVKIRHAGEVYRLRVTRNGKLILNK